MIKDGTSALYLLAIEDELKKKTDLLNDLHQRLEDGRHYLMGVEPEDLTVEDALEAFGFGRNGLRN